MSDDEKTACAPGGDDDSAVRAEVMRLHYLEGLSVRAIARRLHRSRRIVRQHLGRVAPRAAKATGRRPSLLDAYDDLIRTWLAESPELRAPQVLDRLRKRGFSGGVTIVRDRVRRLRPMPAPKAYLVLDFAPGEVMQVDWADFGFALPGVPRRVSAFVAALGYSRYLYIEFVLSQAMGAFLRCMDRALAFFGGTATADVFDNMKTVVLEHRPGLRPRFNPRFLAYANARGGFAVVACTPGHPEAKGGVERGIRYVRENFWPGRRFRDLADLRAQADDWRDRVANRREHAATGKVPALAFEHEEKPRLKPVPPVAFDTDDLDHDTVSSTFRVRFDRNRYSVPWRLTGQHVIVRGNDDTVRVFLGPKCIASHARSWDIGGDIEDPAHPRDLREFRNQKPLDVVVDRFGDVGRRYFDTLSAGTRSIRRESLRLTYLAELFGTRETRSAMESVMQTGHVGVEYVEYVLRHKRRLEPGYTPLELGNPALDSITLREPDLSVYDPPVMTRDPGEPPTSLDNNAGQEGDHEG
jgi:transposase